MAILFDIRKFQALRVRREREVLRVRREREVLQVRREIEKILIFVFTGKTNITSPATGQGVLKRTEEWKPPSSQQVLTI